MLEPLVLGIARCPYSKNGHRRGDEYCCQPSQAFFCAFRGKLDFAIKPRTRFFPLQTRFFPMKLDFPAILRKFYITKYNLK